MIAKIRHVATHTEHYDKECKFYQTIFGMKQITTGLVDENGKSNPDRGHISDGVIGMALLAKRAGSQAGIDHFGFEVDDVGEAVDRLNRLYPDFAAHASPDLRARSPALARKIRRERNSIYRKRARRTSAKAISRTAGSSRAGSITSLCARASRRKSPNSTPKSWS